VKNKEKGFGLIGILVGIAVITVVAGSGFYFLKNTNQTLKDKGGNYNVVDQTEEQAVPISSTPNETIVSNDIRKWYDIGSSTVRHFGVEVKDADISTFQELGDRWAKDKNYVYESGLRQTFLDPETVRIFPHIYVADKSMVWVYATGYGGRFDKTDADPATFSAIPWTYSGKSQGYGKDSDSVYYFSDKVIGADVLTFNFLGDGYAKDKNNVYYGSSTILNSDKQSFIFLGDGYAKDSNNVYHKGKILSGVDSASFTLVDGYAKDKNNVFRWGKILDIEIDPTSFSVVSDVVIKDDKRVYFRDYDVYNLASNVDAGTFEYIGKCKCVEKSCRSYFKDKNNIFIENKPIDLIDTPSFQYIGFYGTVRELPYSVSYSKDLYNVYHSCGLILEDANPSTFNDLGNGYAKDKNTVWYIANVIEEADIPTFTFLEGYYAKDKNYTYNDGEKLIPENWVTSVNDDLGIKFKHPGDWKISETIERTTANGISVTLIRVYSDEIDQTAVYFFKAQGQLSQVESSEIEIIKSDTTKFNVFSSYLNGNQVLKRTDVFKNNECTKTVSLIDKNGFTYGSEIVACPTHPERYDQVRIHIANSLEFLN